MHRQKAKSCLIIDIHTKRPEYHYERTRKDRQKPRIMNIIETMELWKLKTEVVPVVLGAFGTIHQNLKFYLRKIGIHVLTCWLKTVILGTAFILRRVPGISEFRSNSDVK